MKLTGAVTEDCGPCTQLVAAMALEAGVAPAVVAAVRNLLHFGLIPLDLRKTGSYPRCAHSLPVGVHGRRPRPA